MSYPCDTALPNIPRPHAGGVADYANEGPSFSSLYSPETVALSVRPARPDDAADAAGLLYEAAAPAFERFAGSRESAIDLLRTGFGKPGHAASYEVTLLAERDGVVAGALAAFSVKDGGRLVRRTMSIQVPRLGPRRWLGAMAAMRALSAMAPPPPPDALYVDALAVAVAQRRQGVGRRLLDAAAESATSAGHPRLALATSLDNIEGQALYLGYGFVEAARRKGSSRQRSLGGFPGFISYVLEL